MKPERPAVARPRDADVERARALLHEAQVVTCLTGAGISAESGIPTFREAQTGLWARFDPDELGSAAGFRRRPRRVWQWYCARLRRARQAQPNAGHRALARMARAWPRLHLFTQNVDDLHERAGSPEVWHLHGELARFQCLECRTPCALGAEALTRDAPPVCPSCAGLIRPAVVWFGENLDAALWQRARAACQACQTMLVVGTSGLVWPAAELPLIAQDAGARLIEVNPEATSLSSVADVWLEGPAGQALPLLVD